MSNKLTEEEFKIIVDLAKVKGVEVCENWIDKGLSEFSYIDDDSLTPGKDFIDGSRIDRKTSFNEILERLSKIESPKEYPTIQLTEEYKAVVKDGFVEVGCQKIDFKKIRSLNALIDEVEGRSVEKLSPRSFIDKYYDIDVQFSQTS